MIVTICVLQIQLTPTHVAAILDVANMAAPVLIRLGAHQKSNKYGLGNIYAKYGAFGRIWTKHYLWCPNSPDYI